MLIRRETAADVAAVRAVHRAAFPTAVEADLVDALRADPGWLPALSLVGEDGGTVAGHVVCSRAAVDGEPVALGLGPIGVLPQRQRRGIGSTLLHAVVSVAEALGEPLVVLLGDPAFYRPRGFVPAADLGLVAPDPAWGEHFMARALGPHPRGAFRYAAPFEGL